MPELPLSEKIIRLAPFILLACKIASSFAFIIAGLLCFAKVLIPICFAKLDDNAFFQRNRAIFSGVPPERAIQSVIETALFAPLRVIFFSSESENDFQA